ncbi:HBS1-like protein isoform X1 [Ostrea edulis]|uniref:HBS1-like protein isoform X1 n=1 Tax=Ostrea edulis TaxID=37623 RepID=UPI0020963859|nr:HBS1-like protein isoform X1 [Ostrea edulis]
MSRHRNVRTMNYEDEYYDEDEVYGHSYDDSYCVSPATAAQFTFNRERDINLSSYMEEGIPEEEDESDHEPLNDSGRDNIKLSDVERARLNSCLEEIGNVLGDTIPEHIVSQTVVKNHYNIQASLNELLNKNEAPKPQRQPRADRRSNRQDGLSEFAPVQPTVQLKTPVKKTSTPDITTSAVSQKKPASTTEELVKSTVNGLVSVSSAGKSAVKDSRTNAVNRNTNSEVNVTADDRRDVNVTADDRRDVNVTADDRRDDMTDVVDTSLKVANSEVDLCAELTRKSELDISSKPTLSIVPATPKSTSKMKQDKAKLKAEYEKRKTGKDLLNLVVIGHVDAGKSTLMGHLLYQLGVVNKRAMHKYEQESRKLGKGSFAYAWVLDETEEERSRGVTMDIAQTTFETPNKQITLLDAPGHKDFIPNMITGTAQADVAILVVNATRGEFETGFESGGQTREHALLARSLGVSQLLVAVNKMDTVDWSQSRYDDIVKKLGLFLKQAGYKDSDLSYIPCSGLGGENLAKTVTEPKLSAWYKGSTLVEQIDKFKPVERSMDKPFRLIISDVFKGMGSGFSVVGRVSSGSVQSSEKVLVQPAGDLAVVKGVSMEDSDNTCGFAGDHVTIVLTGMDMAHVNVGSVICDPQNPIKSAIRIRARIVLFNLELPITKGYTVVFHYQSITEPAVIKRLNSQLNKNTGEVVKSKPKCLVKNSSAVVEIEFERPVCLEMYKDYKDLGRFMLRNGGHTIAAGLVEEVLKTKSKTEENSTE